MNVFDIVGPVMIGPSSSHTAGADRIGLIARELLSSEPVKADILLSGSFARTYKGHGTDKALIAGIMGFRPDDIRIRNAPEIAAESGLEVKVHTGQIPDTHPNTARIELTDAKGHQVSVVGNSIGGGNIRISSVNGMRVVITGHRATLVVLHRDVPGIIAAVTVVLTGAGVNIAEFHLARLEPGGEAAMTIGIEGTIDPDLCRNLSSLPHIHAATIIEPL